MARGKSINLFLMDNTATGRIKCTIPNWTGVVYKIPKIELEKCKGRKDLNQSGVYFLFGVSNKPVVYIGQAGSRKNGNGIFNRLLEHKKSSDKNYWSEAVVFTTSNNSFGPTEISYLENKFCNLAIEAKHCEVKNNIEPVAGNITEEKESELEEFAEYARLIVGTIGYNVFEPETMKNDVIDEEIDVLYLSRHIKSINMTIKAMGRRTIDGFVVLRGSQISPKYVDKISNNIKKLRNNSKINEKNVLMEDVPFSSPSTAAMFVIGNSANGLVEWKNKNGMTLKQLEELKNGHG